MEMIKYVAAYNEELEVENLTDRREKISSLSGVTDVSEVKLLSDETNETLESLSGVRYYFTFNFAGISYFVFNGYRYYSNRYFLMDEQKRCAPFDQQCNIGFDKDSGEMLCGRFKKLLVNSFTESESESDLYAIYYGEHGLAPEWKFSKPCSTVQELELELYAPYNNEKLDSAYSDKCILLPTFAGADDKGLRGVLENVFCFGRLVHRSQDMASVGSSTFINLGISSIDYFTGIKVKLV